MILTYSFDNEYLGEDEEREEVYLNFIDYDYVLKRQKRLWR